jgi:hypothetical protein
LDEAGRVLPAPGFLVRHVGLEIVQDLAHAPGEFLVLQADAQFVIRNFMQDGHGVVIEFCQQRGRENLENFLGALVPGPPDIVGQAVEVGDQFWSILQAITRSCS